MVTLDELTYPLIYGWMPLIEVLQTLHERPTHAHVVIRCSPEVIELADTMTRSSMRLTRAFRPSVGSRIDGPPQYACVQHTTVIDLVCSLCWVSKLPWQPWSACAPHGRWGRA